MRYNSAFGRVWRLVGGFLSLTNWLRFNKLLGETGYRLRHKLRTQYSGRLEWLRTRRFGSEELNFDAVFNLSSVNLSRTQLEILSRGPRFGIPLRCVCKEEVFSEFEL